MRGETFTGEKCSKAGQRGSEDKAGRFSNTKYLNRWEAKSSYLNYSTINQRYASDSFYLDRFVTFSISEGGRRRRFSVVPAHVLL